MPHEDVTGQRISFEDAGGDGAPVMLAVPTLTDLLA
jgi:hypothetical protein